MVGSPWGLLQAAEGQVLSLSTKPMQRASGRAALPRLTQFPAVPGDGQQPNPPLPPPLSSRSGSVPQARGRAGEDDSAEVHVSLRGGRALLLRRRLRAARRCREPVPGRRRLAPSPALLPARWVPDPGRSLQLVCPGQGCCSFESPARGGICRALSPPITLIFVVHSPSSSVYPALGTGGPDGLLLQIIVRGE